MKNTEVYKAYRLEVYGHNNEFEDIEDIHVIIYNEDNEAIMGWDGYDSQDLEMIGVFTSRLYENKLTLASYKEVGNDMEAQAFYVTTHDLSLIVSNDLAGIVDHVDNCCGKGGLLKEVSNV